MEVPRVEVPRVEAPRVEVPRVEVPRVEAPGWRSQHRRSGWLELLEQEGHHHIRILAPPAQVRWCHPNTTLTPPSYREDITASNLQEPKPDHTNLTY